MRVQAEVSLYPLRTTDLSEPIDTFCELLGRHDLNLEVGAMSTRIWGDSKDVFDALHHAFVRLGERHQIVLSVKVSNACPKDVGPEQAEKRPSQDGNSASGSDSDSMNSMRRK